MSESLWTEVDEYFVDRLVGSDDALEGSLAASAAAGLPAISITPNQGKALMLLARAISAGNILELGTLGGYSTIWLARALVGGAAGGRVTTLEVDPRYAELARANIARAGLAGKVDIRVGRAIETLPELLAEKCGPFDFIFIDADKASTPDYFRWAIRLSRVGTIIVVDNVVREGAVIDAASEDAGVRGIREFCEIAANEPRVFTTAIQTVGSKGYDGFAIALVVAA